MERLELLERYKLAHAECRAEVTLGWQRQQTFMLLVVGLTAAAVFTSDGVRMLAFMSFVVAWEGIMVIRASHRRYRAARDAVLALEDSLGFSDLQTTGGQREARGKPRSERYRVVDIVTAVLAIIGALDVRLLFTG